MLTIINNTSQQNNTFAPWQITDREIRKGSIALPISNLKLEARELNVHTHHEHQLVSNQKLFLDFDRTNLEPSLTASSSDKTYFVTLLTHQLEEGEKVVYVRSEKGYLLEWNYNVLSGHFDAIVAFRASHLETSITIYIANAKGEVKSIKIFRNPNNESAGVKYEPYKISNEIRTDKKLSILPYRPYKLTKHIIAHRSQIAKAKELLGENNGYVFHEYLHLKSARQLAEMIKRQGVTAISIFYDENELTDLTDDQRFFVRAIAEYFKFVNISYKNTKILRYYFSGKTTLPKRKQYGNKGKKKNPSARKPEAKASEGKKKHEPGKKPRSQKRPNEKAVKEIKHNWSSAYGSRNSK